MKNFISIIIAVLSVLAGVYIGGWVMFIGGIVGLIDAIKATELIALDVAINIAKILLASLVGWIVVYLGLFIAALISGKKKRKFKIKK